ncbi:MAG TPA: DUF3060 domain-containing protein [Mycobacterium sp.]|nr:DUF3060 domain-containing protein [Mycobacterium sp.]
MAGVWVGILTAAIVLTGCGAFTATGPASPASTDRSKSNAQREIGNVINYDPSGTTTQLDCGDGKSLNVRGSNNKLTVKGSCTSVAISGADNRIGVERIDKSLTITGLANTVSYRGGHPRLDDRGSGNTVTTG